MRQSGKFYILPFPKAAAALLVCAVCLICVPVGMTKDEDAQQKKIERIKNDLLQQEKNMEALRAKEESIFEQLNYFDKLVALQNRKLANSRNEMILVEKKMLETQAEMGVVEERLKRKRAVLAKRFRRMYMDGTSGVMEVFLSAESFSDLSRREVYYRAMVRADAAKIKEFRVELDEFKLLLAKLDAEKLRLKSLEAEILASKRAAEKELAAKKSLMKAATEDVTVNQKVVTELKTASKKIGGIIVSHQRKKALATPVPLPFSPDPAIPLPPPEPPPPPVGDDFADNAGRMCAPCRGGILQSYGTITNPRFGTKTFSSGIAISATEGSAVAAVWDGEVAYAGWFRGYGKIVILSHGNRYYTLYGHLSGISVSKGDTVKRGQTVGRVGDTGSLYGPRLYFEVRRGSSAMNPTSWVSLGCGG